MNVTRRNFLEGAASVGALLAVAGCSGAGVTDAESSAPAAESYPLDPDGDGVKAKYTTEIVGDVRTGNGWTKVTNEDGAVLGLMDASRLIQVAGYAFKDLDGDGKLSLWEDWRQNVSDRSADLADKLDSDEAIGLMIHGSTFTVNTDLTADLGVSLLGGSDGDPTSVQDAINNGIRTMLNFGTTDTGKNLASWNNLVQEASEKQGYGIPFCISNNPQTFGYPATPGLAASFDPALVTEAAKYQARCYRATGVATLLGPQIGLNTEPRWSRVSGALGEDPALVRDMSNAIISGMQSTYDEEGNDKGWGADSVVCQMKHFPGDGCAESGREAHSAAGKFNVYPGDNFQTQLIPFVDGAMKLDSSTGESAACMTSYSIAYSDDEEYGELVGSGFSKWKVDLLRNDRDYDGLMCTDWGITNDLGGALATSWGMENATRAERHEKIVEAGMDQIGGSFDLISAKDGYGLYVADYGEDNALARYRDSARRVLKTFYLAGLFENPYFDSTVADDVLEDEDGQSAAAEACDKAVIMLKNTNQVLGKTPGENKPKVYVPMSFAAASKATMSSAAASASWSLPVEANVLGEYFELVTDAVSADADPANLTETDVIRASADQLSGCDFGIVFVATPSTGNGYVANAGGTFTYLPISLQYGAYVADGESVRRESIAGDVVDGVRENRSYYGASTVATNLGDMQLVQGTKLLLGGVPLVVCVNATRPMCYGEIEPSADAILMGFGMNDLMPFIHIVSGQTEPSGLLPFQMPRDMDTVEAQREDTPRDMDCYEDSAGNAYDFAFGMNWSGVIEDDRVRTYKVDPILRPEN